MNLIRMVARLLTGSTYVFLGVDAVKAPGGRVSLAAPTLDLIRKIAPLPQSDEVVVRGNAAVQATAGALLVSGRFPRTSAVVLAASMVPTTLAGHPFWTLEDPAVRKMQRIQFHKNLAMIGGLLFMAVDQQSSTHQARQ